MSFTYGLSGSANSVWLLRSPVRVTAPFSASSCKSRVAVARDVAVMRYNFRRSGRL